MVLLSTRSDFIRVDKTGNPDEGRDVHPEQFGNTTEVDECTVIDEGFLELTRLGKNCAVVPR